MSYVYAIYEKKSISLIPFISFEIKEKYFTQPYFQVLQPLILIMKKVRVAKDFALRASIELSGGRNCIKITGHQIDGNNLWRWIELMLCNFNCNKITYHQIDGNNLWRWIELMICNFYCIKITYHQIDGNNLWRWIELMICNFNCIKNTYNQIRRWQQSWRWIELMICNFNCIIITYNQIGIAAIYEDGLNWWYVILIVL